MTLPQIAQLLLATRAARGVSPNYLTTLRAMLAKLSRQFPGELAALNIVDIETWLGLMKSRTSNNYLAVLRQVFGFAHRRKLLSKDFDLAAIDRRVVPPGEPKIYSPGEVRRILLACDETVLPVVALTVFAGVRAAEALRLSWEAVDFERKRVVVAAGQAKTRSRRICSLAVNLEAWLGLSPRRGVGLIFPGTRKAFGDRYRLALDAAGVTPKRNGLRHSFVSYHLAWFGSAGRTALEAGHTETMLFANYRELVTAEAAREFWNVRPNNGQLALELAA